MVKAIIFDFDGVICDSKSLAKKILGDLYNKDLSEEEFAKIFDKNLFKSTKVSNEDSMNLINSQKDFFENLKIELKIKNELLKLKENYNLFIISSNSQNLLINFFENNNLSTLFTSIYGLETHKSKIAKFNILNKEFNLETKDYIFVTDTLGDILEANEAGVKTMAVDFGFHTRNRLEKGNPFKIISDLSQIGEILKNE